MDMCNKTIEPIRLLHPHQINTKITCILYCVRVCIMKSKGILPIWLNAVFSAPSIAYEGLEGREGERGSEGVETESVYERERERERGGRRVRQLQVDTGYWKGMWYHSIINPSVHTH